MLRLLEYLLCAISTARQELEVLNMRAELPLNELGVCTVVARTVPIPMATYRAIWKLDFKLILGKPSKRSTRTDARGVAVTNGCPSLNPSKVTRRM